MPLSCAIASSGIGDTSKFSRMRVGAFAVVNNAVPRCTAHASSTCAGVFPVRRARSATIGSSRTRGLTRDREREREEHNAKRQSKQAHGLERVTVEQTGNDYGASRENAERFSASKTSMRSGGADERQRPKPERVARSPSIRLSSSTLVQRSRPNVNDSELTVAKPLPISTCRVFVKPHALAVTCSSTACACRVSSIRSATKCPSYA